MLLWTKGKTPRREPELKSMMMRMDHWDVNDWTYLAEGNANLLFRYVGAPSPALDQMVLRLRKIHTYSKNETTQSPSHILQYINDELLPLMNELNECQTTNYHQVAQKVTLPPDFLHACVRRYPAIDSKCTEGLILPNFNQLGDICIELKPKTSFKSCREDDRHSLKSTICRYCLHQHYKIHMGKVDQVSSYCPMDLFSHHRMRMTAALTGLFETPQNNLRMVHRNGTTFNHVNSNSVNDDHHDHECFGDIEQLVQVLVEVFYTQSSFLRDIARVQYQMKGLDIEHIWEFHLVVEKILQGHELQGLVENIAEVQTVSRVFDHVLSLVHEHEFVKRSWRDWTKSDLVELYDVVLNKFLIGATMKDCSILMSLRECSSGNPSDLHEMEQHVVQVGGCEYAVALAVVDLDPKHVSKIPHYIDLDRDIVRHFYSLKTQNKVVLGNLCSVWPDPNEITVIRSGQLMSRFLYPQPVCLLTTTSSSLEVRNVMTISWLTPVDNHGRFVCSMNQKRHSAQVLQTPGAIFVLNIPSNESKDLVYNIGQCSGRDVDKIDTFQLPTCPPGWYDPPPSKKKQKKNQERIAQSQSRSFALVNTIAHVLCTVEHQRVMDNGHILFTCRQLCVWSRSAYFDGSVFAPPIHSSLPPYMGFLGSGQFSDSQRTSGGPST